MALRAVPDHPKFADLKARLSVPRYVALGALETLWHFTGRFTPQGNIGKYSDAQIEAWLEWDGAPGALITALIGSRWVDRDTEFRILVHDWAIHADKATKQALNRAKMEFCVPTVCTEFHGVHTLGAHSSVLKSLPVPVPVPVPVPEPEPEPQFLRPLPDSSPRMPKTMWAEAPIDFVEWWAVWSGVRGTAKKQQALQAWMSIQLEPGVWWQPVCLDCTRSYLDSLENPAKGFNPDTWLYEQSRDGFEARWPKFERRSGKPPVEDIWREE